MRWQPAEHEATPASIAKSLSKNRARSITHVLMPGPPELGRGVILSENRSVPTPFRSASHKIRIDADVLTDPATTLATFRKAWQRREATVTELAVDPEALREPERTDQAPWQAGPRFSFLREELYQLIRSNSYDARGDDFVWWPAIEAVRLGAKHGVHVAGPADVMFANGAIAFCDGGPRRPIVGLAAPILHRHEVAEAHRLTCDRTACPSGDLAVDQMAAVRHAVGPALVSAPAGSGKTRVLTSRLSHLISDRGYAASGITALAYNTRAAQELRDRLADLPELAASVRTLHAFGYRLLRQHRATSRVADEREVRNRIGQLVDVRPRRNVDVYAPFLEALAAVRNRLLSPKVVEESRDDVPGFANAFERYRAGLYADGIVDHDEQIYGAIEVLLRDPKARQAAQWSCRNLLVDEYQDLTPAQLLFVRLLAAPFYNVFAVGDTDQTIYGYAGADPSFMLDFADLFPSGSELALYPLEVNYRCPRVIVAAADCLLTHNVQRIPKRIRAADNTGVEPSALMVQTAPAAELAAAATRELQIWLDTGAEPGDIAVLARTNAILLPVQALLTQANVPVQALLGLGVLRRTGIRTALAWLRLGLAAAADLPLDRDDLAEAIKRPSRKLDRETRDLLTRRSIRFSDREGTLAHLDERYAVHVDGFFDDIDLVASKLCSGATSSETLRMIRDDIGIASTLDTLDRSRLRPDGSHTDDVDGLVAIAGAEPDPAAFEAFLHTNLRSAHKKSDRSTGSQVTLASIHKVKGLEWNHVVIYGASTGLLPHRLSEDDEEERRLFHVALTRARVQAVIVAHADRKSPFLDEMTIRSDPATLSQRHDQQGAGRESGRRGGETRMQMRTPSLPPDIRERLTERLKQWRRVTASARNVPAYIVCLDRTIEDIITLVPTDLETLAGCYGIGPTKLDEYGDDILAIVDELTP